MKQISKTIVFFGNERLATGVATTAPILRALIDAGYNIAAVVSNYSADQSKRSRELEIKAVAEQNNLPLWLPEKPALIKERLRELRAETGVLVAYGKIVPQSIIDIFPKGIINIHPSLLPLHRGPTPIESVILDASEKTGVSIMQLAREMDSGPVFASTKVTLTGEETKQELADRLLDLGKDLLINNLPAILEGKLLPQPQDDSHASYDYLIKKEDGVIDWRKPATQIEREIRAYAAWPKSRAALGGIEVIITKAHAVPSNDLDKKPGDIEVLKDEGTLLIECGGGYLCVDELKPAGKKDMSAQAFIAGYGQRLKR